MVITNQSLVKAYTTIDKMPMSAFIAADVDGDLQALIIEGEATPNELIPIWNDLREQYADAIGDGETKHLLQLVKKLNDAKCKLYLIHVYIEELRKCYVKKWANDVKRLVGSSVTLNPDDEAGYDKTLDGYITRSKSVEMEIAKLSAGVEKLQKGRPESTGKPTIAYYDQLFIAISDYKKREVNESVTVSKFCIMLRQLNHYQEQTKNKK